MRKKLIALLSAVSMLVAHSTTCFAAQQLPIAHANQYVFSVRGGGNYEYTVPYTGNYTITLAGASGAAYGATSGGAGYSFTKSVRLECGSKIVVSLPEQPARYTDGGIMYVPGGKKASLWYKDSLVWEAGGGSGAVVSNIAENGVLQVWAQDGDTDQWQHKSGVHWHTGDGKSGATHVNSFPTTVYKATSTLGGCYRAAGHTHNKTGTCPYYEQKIPYTCECDKELKTIHGKPHNVCKRHLHICDWCGGVYGWCDSSYAHKFKCHCPTEVYTCGDYINTHTLACGYSQGQIYQIGTYTAGTKYFADGWEPQASLSNKGDAIFCISLDEQYGLMFYNTTVKLPDYLESKCELILNDNTVVYYKR